MGFARVITFVFWMVLTSWDPLHLPERFPRLDGPVKIAFLVWVPFFAFLCFREQRERKARLARRYRC